MRIKIIVMITVLIYFVGCETTNSYISYQSSSDFKPSENTKYLLVPLSNVNETLKKYSTWVDAVYANDPIATKKTAKDVEIESYITASLANRGWELATNESVDYETAYASGNLLMIIWDFTEHFNTSEKQVSSPVYGQTGNNTYTSGTVNTTGFGATYSQNTYSSPTYGITGYEKRSVEYTTSHHRLQIAGMRLPDKGNGSFEFTAVRQNKPNVGYLRSIATILSSCNNFIGERSAGEIIRVNADPYGQDTENLIATGELVYDVYKYNKTKSFTR